MPVFIYSVLMGFRFLKVSNTVHEAETNSLSDSRFATSFHTARPQGHQPTQSDLHPPALRISVVLTNPAKTKWDPITTVISPWPRPRE